MTATGIETIDRVLDLLDRLLLSHPEGRGPAMSYASYQQIVVAYDLLARLPEFQVHEEERVRDRIAHLRQHAAAEGNQRMLEALARLEQ